ncbi:hypothetical protein ACSBR2_019528 [Camellia fascicularis]
MESHTCTALFNAKNASTFATNSFSTSPTLTTKHPYAAENAIQTSKYPEQTQPYTITSAKNTTSPKKANSKPAKPHPKKQETKSGPKSCKNPQTSKNFSRESKQNNLTSTSPNYATSSTQQEQHGQNHHQYIPKYTHFPNVPPQLKTWAHENLFTVSFESISLLYPDITLQGLKWSQEVAEDELEDIIEANRELNPIPDSIDFKNQNPDQTDPPPSL